MEGQRPGGCSSTYGARTMSTENLRRGIRATNRSKCVGGGGGRRFQIGRGKVGRETADPVPSAGEPCPDGKGQVRQRRSRSCCCNTAKGTGAQGRVGKGRGAKLGKKTRPAHGGCRPVICPADERSEAASASQEREKISKRYLNKPARRDENEPADKKKGRQTTKTDTSI